MTEQAPRRPVPADTIASYLMPIGKALEGRSVDARSLFARAGIDTALSNDPLARLPHHQIGKVFRLAVEETGDPYFGLYASRYMLPAHIHALGSALLASRNLLDLCQRVERYGGFLAQTVQFYVDRGEKETQFGAHLKVPLRAEAMDMFWSFIVRFMRHLHSEGFNPLRVDVPRVASPDASLAYAAFFRCPLSFGHQEMALHLSTPALEQDLPTASSELAQLSDQVVQEYLAKLDRDDIASRVRSLLVANLPSGEFAKEDAAQQLHMSPRTLQKKLREAGTSWRVLLDGTRFELAVSCLESGRYSLAEITYMLGFNDTSSFSRAFKRWSGKPPGEYK